MMDLSAQNAALGKELQAAKEAQARSEASAAILTSEKAQLATQIKEIHAKLDVANKETATLVRAKADEVERVRAAERNASEARDKSESILRELNALKTRNEELERQLKQSQSALALAQAAAMEQIANSPAGATLGLAPGATNTTKNPSVSAAVCFIYLIHPPFRKAILQLLLTSRNGQLDVAVACPHRSTLNFANLQ